MKKNSFLLILLLFSGSLLCAQNNSFIKFFEKYENEDDVTVVSISKAMFNLIPNNIQTGDINIRNISSKIESMLLLSTEKSTLAERMKTDFSSVVNQDKSYEELMRIRDGKTNIMFHALKKGEIINELVMLINDEGKFVAIRITGNFTMDDIQKVIE